MHGRQSWGHPRWGGPIGGCRGGTVGQDSVGCWDGGCHKVPGHLDCDPQPCGTELCPGCHRGGAGPAPGYPRRHKHRVVTAADTRQPRTAHPPAAGTHWDQFDQLHRARCGGAPGPPCLAPAPGEGTLGGVRAGSVLGDRCQGRSGVREVSGSGLGVSLQPDPADLGRCIPVPGVSMQPRPEGFGSGEGGSVQHRPRNGVPGAQCSPVPGDPVLGGGLGAGGSRGLGIPVPGVRCRPGPALPCGRCSRSAPGRPRWAAPVTCVRGGLRGIKGGGEERGEPGAEPSPAASGEHDPGPVRDPGSDPDCDPGSDRNPGMDRDPGPGPDRNSGPSPGVGLGPGVNPGTACDPGCDPGPSPRDPPCPGFFQPRGSCPVPGRDNLGPSLRGAGGGRWGV